MKNINDLIISISTNQIAELSHTKFLGIIIDNKLNWADHISYIKVKSQRVLGLYLKFRHMYAKKALVSFYYAIVIPYLIYCIEVWGYTFDYLLEPIFKLQKKM